MGSRRSLSKNLRKDMEAGKLPNNMILEERVGIVSSLQKNTKT